MHHQEKESEVEELRKAMDVLKIELQFAQRKHENHDKAMELAQNELVNEISRREKEVVDREKEMQKRQREHIEEMKK